MFCGPYFPPLKSAEIFCVLTFNMILNILCFYHLILMHFRVK